MGMIYEKKEKRIEITERFAVGSDISTYLCSLLVVPAAKH